MILKGKKVFIVEDNVNNRVIFHLSLVRAGAMIDFERWGENTILRLKNSIHADLIILDLMLAHEVSGFDIYDQIREMPNYESIPIVAVSAMEPAVAIPIAQEKGFAGFIAKPINPKLFVHQLAKILDGERIWHTGERKLS